MSPQILATVFCAFLHQLCGVSDAAQTQGEAARVFARSLTLVPATGAWLTASKDWIGKTTDNICGLRDVAQVSNPAVVDWQACLDATPEMKKAKQDKVDLTTPEGIQVVTAATNRVTAACEVTRTANAYCSVWKTIKHKDGRAVADITELVKAQY